MEIRIAKTAGFCMGVRRAVDLTLRLVQEKKKHIYMYGPLIHNSQVLDFFSKKSVCILDKIPGKGIGTVIIRAHGISPNIENQLHNAGFNVVDATCPRVSKVQKIIEVNSKRGYSIIILGDKNHPEVLGLVGYAKSDVHVICNIDQLKSLPQFKKAIVVSQTTQNIEFYKRVKNWIHKQLFDYNIYNTICDSTKKRQEEICKIASSVDVVVVVGSKKSGNTNRLKEVVGRFGKRVIHVETKSELLFNDFLFKAKKVGITAGASTPNWIIKEVYTTICSLAIKEV